MYMYLSAVVTKIFFHFSIEYNFVVKQRPIVVLIHHTNFTEET